MNTGSCPLVEITGLSFSINEAEILKEVSLSIGKGEFVGLIGPNGAGKTTLLKCINGINKSKGVIKLNGYLLEEMNCREIARNVAMMNQNTAVSFPFPAIDVVLSGRYPYLKRLQGESRQDYAIARKYMEYTDTQRLELKPITRMSGGERQKVLFAKALAQETDIVLLDEPSASLDIAHEEQIFKLSLELTSKGRTVIAAVHDLKIAARYCSRLILMHNGIIMADGNVEEVMTSENLSRAYGVNAFVYKNKITGCLDYFIHNGDNSKAKKRIHVIGGGGSSSGVIRQLFEGGYKITAGVFAHGDSDLQSADIFGIERIVCKPFSDIDDPSMSSNSEMIKGADMTVLCNMPFGKQNFRNLEAAQYAKSLIIIEDDPPQTRDFTGGRALKLYERLKENAIITTSASLHEVV